MSDKLLRGKPVTEAVYTRVGKQVEFLKSKNISPKLTVILVGEDPASKVYVGRKGKACQKLGIESETIYLPEQTTEQELLQYLYQLNRDSENHGILVQLPLPKHIDEQTIIRSIDPAKDVDCFHPQNVGLLVNGAPYMLPCTPAGIVEMFDYYDIETAGKHLVVLGRSNIVGKPMLNLMIQKNAKANATVTMLHSRTVNLESYTKQADIIVAAMGQANFIKRKHVKEGVVVIDVGINRVEADNEKGYALVGDVDFDEVAPVASLITPVPGGVGPMTIAMLMQNTVVAAAAQSDLTL